MTTREIVELAGLAVAVLVIIIFITVTVIKNKWTTDLVSVVDKACGEAEEKWPEGHGKEKKQYVMEAVRAKCKDLKIPFDILIKLISKLVESAVKSYNSIKLKR